MGGLTAISRWLPVLALTMLMALTTSAQEHVIEGLHARGYTALNYSRDMTDFASGQGFGEEISTDLQGALFNPNFISLSSSFTYGHSSNSLAGVSLAAANTIAGSATTMVLPGSVYPLIITYQRTRVGLGQAGFDTTTNTDRLGFDWRLNLDKLPKLAVLYSRDSSWSDVPVASFVPTDTHGSGFGISASDNWKGWDWVTGWQRSTSDSATFLIDSLARFKQKYSIIGAETSKHYFSDKGLFNYSFARNDTQSELGSLSVVNGVQNSHQTSTVVRFTPKLTTSGAFQYYNFSSDGRMTSPTDPTQQVQILSFPSSGYAGSGSVAYQIHPRIAVSDSTSYSSAEVAPSPLEQPNRYFSNYPVVAANYTWRRIRFNASYGLGYIATGTTFDRWYGGLSNTGSLGVSWSHPWISLGGGFGMGHGSNDTLPGSYVDTTNYLITGESARLRRLGKLRFRWNMYDRTLLGSMGLIDSRRTNWSLALTRRRMQVEGGGSTGTGARQAFEVPVISFRPIPALIGVPLLDDTGRNYFIHGSWMLRPNMQVRGTYRRDINEIRRTGGSASYSLFEVYLDYRVGKVVIDASYGHYLNVSDTVTSNWGSAADRIRFRIARTFNLF